MSQEPPDPPESEDGGGDSGREMIVLLAILVEGGLLVLATVLGWAFDKPPVRELNWNAIGVLEGVAAALPMVAVFFLTQRWPVGPLRRLRRFAEEVIRPVLAPCTVIDLLGISVLAGLGEELFFRGTMQGVLSQWLDDWRLALVLASLVFGLLHAITFTYAALATLAGLYLGLAAHYTGNLLVAVVAHALYDFLVLLWLLRGPGATQAAPPDVAAGKTEIEN
jgi:membrane protease YdiL (CAAX protease family)